MPQLGLSKENDYVRLDSPSLWLEYSGQPSRDFPDTVHPHSAWRDRLTDYSGRRGPRPGAPEILQEAEKNPLRRRLRRGFFSTGRVCAAA